ncbi:MAG: peptidoglycan-binding protein, partial [Desulfuromusa sp.]|nr:peptidoglycan-binding protein [Desulfuromusa sp.]
MSDIIQKIDALIYKGQEQIRQLKAKGEMAKARAVFNQVVKPLGNSRLKIIEGNLQVIAIELNSLSGVLEKAIQDLARDVDSFFLNDLVLAKKEVDVVKGGPGVELRSGRAEDTEIAPQAPVDFKVESETADEIRADATASGGDLPRTKAEYVKKFKNMVIREKWFNLADKIVDRIIDPDNAKRYREVERRSTVPWWYVGLLHLMETSFNFDKHIHNGDPLGARTVNVPVGRPPLWTVGMTWEDSAVDALTEVKNLDEVTDWSLGAILLMMEKWNGLGYRKHGVYSPFLWSGSTYYEEGKYVRDGVFDPKKISDQCGISIVLKRMEDRKVLGISGTAKIIKPKMPAFVGSVSLANLDTSFFKHAEAELKFPKILSMGMGGPGDTKQKREAVGRVQEWCCYHGLRTGVDGDYGGSTLKVVKRFQARINVEQTGIVDEETWSLLTRPMREVLETMPPARTLNETVIQVAQKHIDQRPIEIGGNNFGPWVRLYMKGKEGNAYPWCAGFVSFVGSQAAKSFDA